MKQYILSFLYLTIGYWFVSFLIPLIILISPLVTSQTGISTSESDGVTHVRFDGKPGDVIFIALVKNSGQKVMAFEDTTTTQTQSTNSSSTHMLYNNSLISLFSHIVFALISIPILRRLLVRKIANNEA